MDEQERVQDALGIELLCGYRPDWTPREPVAIGRARRSARGITPQRYSKRKPIFCQFCAHQLRECVCTEEDVRNAP